MKICSGVRLTGQQGCVTHLAISNDSTVKQFQQCCVLPTTLLLQTVGLACESSRVGQIQGRYCQHPLDIQIPTSQPWRLGMYRLKSPYRFTLHCLEPAQASRRSVLCLRLQLSEYTIPRPLTRTHEKLQAWTLSQDYYRTKYKQVWCLVPIRKCRCTDFKS